MPLREEGLIYTPLAFAFDPQQIFEVLWKAPPTLINSGLCIVCLQTWSRRLLNISFWTSHSGDLVLDIFASQPAIRVGHGVYANALI
jgi:hypothetical protein